MQKFQLSRWTERSGSCKHRNKIPGLDATGCPTCRTWWVDVAMRETLVPAPKKGGKRDAA